MRYYILTFLLLMASASFAQQPTQKEMQQQMSEALKDARKQVDDLKKEIAEAKSRKDDPQSIIELEKQLSIAEQMLALFQKTSNMQAARPANANKAKPDTMRAAAVNRQMKKVIKEITKPVKEDKEETHKKEISYWTGTVTREETVIHANPVLNGKCVRKITSTFNAAQPTMYRDVETTDMNFTDDKGSGSHSYHCELTDILGRLCVTDCNSSGQAELHSVIVREWDNTYDIEVTSTACIGTTCAGSDGSTQYGPEVITYGASNEKLVNKDVLSGSRSVTAEMPGGLGTGTSTVTWYLVRSTEIDDPCIACGSVIKIENQDLGQEVAVTGTPFTLCYQSNRVNNNDKEGLGIKGWTINVHHSFRENRLFLGDGTRRSVNDDLGPVKAVETAIPGVVQTGGYLIASRDGDEVYAFDSKGKHLRTLDALTGSLIYEFRYENNLLASITDGFGSVTTINRTAGIPTNIMGPYGHRTGLTVDNQSLTAITTPAGTYRFSYMKGWMTKMTDTRGSIFQYHYDSLGNLLMDKDPAGGSTALVATMEKGGQKITKSTALKNSTSYYITYENGVRKRIVTFPDKTKNIETKKADGQILEYADGTVEYVTEEDDPRWGSNAPVAAVFSMRLPGGPEAINKVSREIVLKDPVNPLSIKSLTNISSLNNLNSTFSFESSSRIAALTSPLKRSYMAKMDNKGLLSELRIGGLSPILLTYDAKGRLTGSEQGPPNAIRRYRYIYNTDGLLANEVDPLGNTTTYAYDKAGRIIRHTSPDGGLTDLGYDTEGNLKSIIPPGRGKHLFEFSPVNLTNSYNPPAVAGRQTTANYEYNADQQLTRINRAGGEKINLSYESSDCSCGKLSSLTTADGAIHYQYSASTGLLSAIHSPGGNSLGFEYDGPFVAKEFWKGVITGTMSRSYNNFFDIASDKAGDGPSIAYQYDNDGLLVKAGDLVLTHSTENTLVTGSQLNNITETSEYNSFGELMRQTFKAGGNVVYSVNYTRDLLGRITGKKEIIESNTDSASYQYDKNGRLVSVTKNGVNTSYTYDQNDNRLLSGNTTSSYDEQDRLLQSGGNTYTYSAPGDLLTSKKGEATTHYKHDALGNLLQVALADGKKIDYIVDGRNRRIGVKINNVLTAGFLYDDDLRVIAELDGSGKVITRFVYVRRNHVPDYMIRDGKNYRIITDQLGSPRLIVDATSGAIVEKIDYDVFGNIITDSKPGFQPFGFAGGLYDINTGLTRFGARDYDPLTGRWTAKDPIGFGGGATNLYAYAGNDPVNNIDPTGMWPIVLPGSKLNTKAAKAAPSPEGVCVILAHGNKQGVYSGSGKNQKRLSVNQLLEKINAIPSCRDAHTIRLLACRTAGPYAQELADKSKKKVEAPNVKIKPNTDGSIKFEEPGGKIISHNPDVHLTPKQNVNISIE